MGGCFVSFRGRPRWPEFFCLDPGGLLGDFWVDVLGLGLAGGLTDDVFDDDDLLCGLDCDLENDGDENPCLAAEELKLFESDEGDTSGCCSPSPSCPNNDVTGKPG